jgi:hypothetical protein
VKTLMTDLVAALKQRFDTVFQGHAPIDQSLPCVSIEASPSHDMEYVAGSNEYTAWLPVRLRLFTTSNLDAYNAVDEFWQAVKDLSSTKLLAVRRGAELVEEDPDLDQDGNAVWSGSLSVEFHVQRTR